MPIISSAIILRSLQAENRVYIIEQHRASSGEDLRYEYLVDRLFDADTAIANRVAYFNAVLADREFSRLLSSQNDFNLQHQTAAQFAARLREHYRNSTKEESARVADWILTHIDNGDFTDNQVRNAFGMTVPQYTTFKTKLQNLQANWIAIQTATGE